VQDQTIRLSAFTNQEFRRLCLRLPERTRQRSGPLFVVFREYRERKLTEFEVHQHRPGGREGDTVTDAIARRAASRALLANWTWILFLLRRAKSYAIPPSHPDQGFPRPGNLEPIDTIGKAIVTGIP